MNNEPWEDRENVGDDDDDYCEDCELPIDICACDDD